MITEDYVSFETAKLLKEKGFDWEVHRSYLVNDNCFAPADVNDLPYRKDAIRIPTLQMAMKWLREVHSIDIVIGKAGPKAYTALIIKNNISYPYYPIKNKEKDIYQKFPLYEEACEAAIKYCLENLI